MYENNGSPVPAVLSNTKMCLPPLQALSAPVKNAPSSVVAGVIAEVAISSAVIVFVVIKFGTMFVPKLPVEYAIRTLCTAPPPKRVSFAHG